MDNGEGNGPGSSRKTVRLNRFILPVVHPVVELGILSEKKKSITEGRKAARTSKPLPLTSRSGSATAAYQE